MPEDRQDSSSRVKLRLRRKMHSSIKEQGRWSGSVLNDGLNDYAVPGSFRFVKILLRHNGTFSLGFTFDWPPENRHF